MEIVCLSKQWLKPLHTLVQQTAYERHLSEDELAHRLYDDLSTSPELLLGAVEDSTLIGFCLGCLREGRGVVTLFGVHPAHRRQGIAASLLKELEARFVTRGVSQILAEGVAPGYFWPGVELNRGPALAFLLSQGYETDRIARVDMAVDLGRVNLDTSASEARLASTGVKIKRASKADIAATAAFALQTFSRGWQLEVEEAGLFPEPPLFIAQRDNQVVGFAAYDVTGYGRFGPTGTRPDLRKQGIGGVLLKLCLAQMLERGDELAEIAWAGPVSFYIKEAKAQISRVYWGFRKVTK